jgi:hypothetical protein
MSEIYIPEAALKNEAEFKKFILTLHAHLFRGAPWKQFKPELPVNDTEALKFIEDIMEIVNFHITGRLGVPNYKNRLRKSSRNITDVLVITNNILQDHYDIRPIKIAKILGFNHSSINYWSKRFDEMLIYKTFKYSYVRIVIDLANHNLIPEVKLPSRELRAIRESIQMAKINL